MPVTRRSVLLGGASSVALISLPGAVRASPAPTIPPELFEPGIDAMAETVRAIVDMLKPSIVGVDFADLQAVLRAGGCGGSVKGRGGLGIPKKIVSYFYRIVTTENDPALFYTQIRAR